MKIEKISDDTIKVTVYLADMIKWNVSYDTMLPKDPDSSEMFWDIIHKATEETGIKFDNCRLVIEAMQNDKDSFTLLITKKNLSEKPVRYKYKSKNKSKSLEKSFVVYSFSSIEDVTTFAKNNLYYCFLFDGKNSLYRVENDIKLIVEISPELKEYVAAFNDRACEYANISRTSVLYPAFLNEHIRPILEKNALKIIYYKF